MDTYWYDGISVYRSVYAPVSSNMFAMLVDNETVIFDPNENNELLELFCQNGIAKAHVLLTHGHYDHISGLGWLKEHVETDVCCHVATAKRLAGGMGSMIRMVPFILAQQDKQDGGHRYHDFKRNYRPYTCLADKTFEKETELTFGNLTFHVIPTPGHSPGSTCYILNDRIVFTGDTLLQDNAVITRFPESDDMIYQQVALPFLKSLRKDMVIMPGHGEPFVLSETDNV